MFNNNLPVLFHCSIAHATVARVTGDVESVTSAGFVTVSVGYELTSDDYGNLDVSVYGKSISLGKKSNSQDAYWIKKLLTD